MLRALRAPPLVALQTHPDTPAVQEILLCGRRCPTIKSLYFNVSNLFKACLQVSKKRLLKPQSKLKTRYTPYTWYLSLQQQ